MPDLTIPLIIHIWLRGLSPNQVNPPFETHLDAALDWIIQAHSASKTGGISKGYDLRRGNWAPAYPETTGYTIPTLLNASTQLNHSDLRELALALATGLLDVATPEGGVTHWKNHSNPIVFDTGQVIFGWLAAYDVSGEKKYLQAALRAAEWLVTNQHASGSWKKYQHLGIEKVIDTRVAWALLELANRSGQAIFRQAAQLNLDWAQQQQNSLGWFEKCSFTKGKDPFTHTLAYTAEGLFKCGQLLNEQKYIESAQCLADALLIRQRKDGSLASTYRLDWSESSRSSCLTGNCQMACLWLNLYQTNQNQAYFEAARKAIQFVIRTQNLDPKNKNVRGAIAGSYPISGKYERFKYPNWAAKFFVDALLLFENTEKRNRVTLYAG